MQHNLLSGMVTRYRCQSLNDYRHALHEIIQEIALLGLWRAKFFEHAAFYGGTALRILYGLERFSEDLDFSLLRPKKDFDLSPYNRAVQNELEAFGLTSSVETKEKKALTSIQSAFIKANAKTQLLYIHAPQNLLSFLPRDEVVKIRMEVDTDPPGFFETESQYLLEPIPFSVNTYTLPHLFSGKLHAILCRAWKNRVKGRDWYDLVWYIRKKVPVHLSHLKERLIQTGHFKATEDLDLERLKQLLLERVSVIDFENAKKDVLPFIKSRDEVAVWSATFFQKIILNIQAEKQPKLDIR